LALSVKHHLLPKWADTGFAGQLCDYSSVRAGVCLRRMNDNIIACITYLSIVR
jgi:hypothetical protein